MKNTKNPTKTKDRWTPIRNGLLYCAPACGAGCTYAEYQAAVNKAEALKKKCEKEKAKKKINDEQKTSPRRTKTKTNTKTT